ncbi:hypothetical protein TWF481_005086 [Arthrobotrys musiformis]|uniref:Uncharacterized protein n=1 Tax=Arthrobotrys musiformis TaxID=47236 RepID=A0AAV9WDF2_9PEZI
MIFLEIPWVMPKLFRPYYKVVEVEVLAPFPHSHIADLADLVVGGSFEEKNRMEGYMWASAEDATGTAYMVRVDHPNSPSVNNYEADFEEMSYDSGGTVTIYLELALPWYFNPVYIVKSFMLFTFFLMNMDFGFVFWGYEPEIVWSFWLMTSFRGFFCGLATHLLLGFRHVKHTDGWNKRYIWCGCFCTCKAGPELPLDDEKEE